MDYPIHMETILPIKTKPETRKCMLKKDLKQLCEHTLSSFTKKYCKYTLIFYWKLSQQILHINIVIHNSPLNGCIKESRLGGAFDGTVNTNDIPKILEMKNDICFIYLLISLNKVFSQLFYC